MQEDLRKLVGRIIVEVDGLCKATLQSWVGIDKVVHLVGITSYDTDKLTTIILQAFQQRIDSLSAKAVGIVRL